MLSAGRTATETADSTRAFEIAGNDGDVVNLTQPHAFKTVSSYAIVYNPSEIVATGQQGPDPIVRAWDRGNGVTEHYVLVVQDRENVTGEYLSRVYPTQDERVQPAVGFVFGPRGAQQVWPSDRARTCRRRAGSSSIAWPWCWMSWCGPRLRSTPRFATRASSRACRPTR